MYIILYLQMYARFMLDLICNMYQLSTPHIIYKWLMLKIYIEILLSVQKGLANVLCYIDKLNMVSLESLEFF